MQKGKLLYKGKAKSLFENLNNKYELIMQYRDDATAFNNKKHQTLAEKGNINNLFNAKIMSFLNKNDIKTHFIKLINDNESLVKNLKMIPLECVVRNRASGSICKRLGFPKNLIFKKPMFEFFYKDDDLDDPLINNSHIDILEICDLKIAQNLESFSLKINSLLQDFFKKIGIILVDFKLEFGIFENEIYLGDEFTPDGARLWDEKTLDSLDKDLFRFDLGDAILGYKEILKRF